MKQSQDGVAEQRSRWNRFAQEDPRFYISAERSSPEQFFADGENVAWLLLELAGPGVRRGRMLEVGCGIGRLLAAFAQGFESVDGVDIAPEMVEQARGGGLPPNVHVGVNAGDALDDFGDAEFDFAACFQVFQHTPDEAVVAGYVAEIARVLRPAGRAVLHFDTRPWRAAERAVFALPDFMLPRKRRRYMRRYRLDRAAPAAMARAAGLRVVRDQDPGTMIHFLVVER